MRRSHPRPRNEQDFELLCVKLLRAYWQCPELELYAVKGEAQHGVDILDVSGREPLRAAQCKLQEEGKVTSRTQVQCEIEKAKGFRPPLDRYLIMTTGKVKKVVHDLLIEINRIHRENKLFAVQVFDWRRIEELLDEFPDVREWYEGGPSATPAGGNESTIEKLYELTKQTLRHGREDDSKDKFHSEIDEARDYINEHNYQMAKLLLQRIKVRSWDKLNGRHRFRILTNLACVEISADNATGAAELYLEAKKYQPDDEMARIHEALAYRILGQREKAFELATKLREEFPRSGPVLRIFIQSAPDSTALESLEDSVPKDLLDRDEVAVALTRRALDTGELDQAEGFIRAATSANSRASMPWLLLGQIILQQEILQSYQKHGTGDLFCDQDRLRESEDAFGRALGRADDERSTSAKVEVLVNRSRTRFLLDKDAEALEDLEDARQNAPDNPIVIESYGESLRLVGRADDAITFMRRLPQEALSDHGRVMLSMLLIERGAPCDYRSAAELLSHVAKSEARLPEDFREHAIDAGFQAFARQERFDAAHKLLEEIPKGAVSEVGFKTLAGRLHLLQGQQDEASQYADDALDITEDATTAFDLRRLARLLSALGRFNDALPLWQRIYVPGVLSEDTRHLLECAHRMNRHEIMLDTFRDLRETGSIDRSLLDAEVALLVRYDTEAAIKILDDEISQRPDDKELRLRRSQMGLALDRADLVDHDPSSMPTADEVAPREAVDAVHVLRAIGHEQYAVQYAYDVLRHNFQNPDTHKAFIQALSPFGNEPQLEIADRVKPGAAVCYVEPGDSVPRWIIVEDSPDPDSQFTEPELSPDDEICKAMIGKGVGDTFILAKGIQDRIGEIREIQNKYVYRYQECTGQWEVRFPQLPYLHVVRIPQKTRESSDSEPDISVILKSVDESDKNVTEWKRIYKKNPIPLHIYGKHFGKTAFEALQGLAWSPDVTVKCCIGLAEEREHATKAFRSCNTVVLDMSAISSLFWLERLDILESSLVDLVVSTSTMNDLRNMIANESRGHSRKSGVMYKKEMGYSFVETTAAAHGAYIKSLRHLVGVLETNCKIASCKSLASIESEKRETLVKLFGQYGAEAILLSAVPGAVLWTDDHVQAEFASTEYGASRVWTQFVIGACVESGMVNLEAYLDASAKLLGYCYYFTSGHPQIIRQAGVIAGWKVDRWPLLQALSSFSDEAVELKQMLQLAAGFLMLLYQEVVLPQSKAHITVKILEEIAKRERGIEGIQGIHRALPTIFGVNVLGLADATKTIEAWLRARSERPNVAF